MNNDKKTPLQTAVDTFNTGVVTTVNAVVSLPEAAAREVVDTIHGEGSADQFKGREFDPHPISSLAERLRGRRNTDSKAPQR